ncbi:MAG: hypothetical protein IPM37_12325 [Hahellaceae bacterium]|nr:hypothetical protein [Hahellaceae bacterium]
MLDWQKFRSLAGQDAANFEKLCRAIVRRRYGCFGPLIGRKNQPGVEYYITLSKDCPDIGYAGEKIGWQCKWFETKSNGELTSGSRSNIQHSLAKTIDHLPDLNRWLLWTPFTLAKPDQDWFYALQSYYPFQLDLLNEEDIEGFLTGSALELRFTYFGELALTPEALSAQHLILVAPIRTRWIKEVHQQVQVEKTLRQMLGEPAVWHGFKQAGDALQDICEAMQQALSNPMYSVWRDTLECHLKNCTEYAAFTERFVHPISTESIDDIQNMRVQAKTQDRDIHKILNQLRSANLPLSIDLTNSLAYLKDIQRLLNKVSEQITCRFVALIADAGGGKTQMAAELSAVQPVRPAGILMHGRDLRKGSTLDDLARRIHFYGQSVPHFQGLLAALNSAADRSNCRLPLIIDGLNEAEDPREWKPLLATAEEQLKEYPNVLLICTLRTGERNRLGSFQQPSGGVSNRENFAQMALPDHCSRLECEGFSEPRDAVISYFQHYKINADLTQLPEDFFSHPLNLRIFCEVTNRQAETVVTITHFPASITTLFNKQLDYVAERITELTNLPRAYTKEDVRTAFYYFGKALWDSCERHISESALLQPLHQVGQDWSGNIINLLSQEGILFRDPGPVPGHYLITPVFDRLGGYIIADYLLKANQTDRKFAWVGEQSTLDRFFGEGEASHALSQDIIYALVALFPQRTDGTQFWMVVPETIKGAIVELSDQIDAEYFCEQTKDAYRAQLIATKPDTHTWLQLKNLRSSGNHPLNSEFLDELLKSLSVKDRDLSWTEFLRNHRDEVMHEITLSEKRWRDPSNLKAEGDRLRAIWVSWQLTSSCREIRDYSTKALYWYGRACPKQLFEITVSSLGINDPYVPERLLAASYGEVMYLVYQGTFLDELRWLATQLYQNMFQAAAIYPTTHFLSRDYASKLIQLIVKQQPGTLSKDQLEAVLPPYLNMPRKPWELVDSEFKKRGDESPFHMDFENYTLGRLVRNRGNYDYGHIGYREIRAKILWRIETLGWNKEDFSEIEKQIVKLSIYDRTNRAKTERYGKKYSWIAFYEMAGQLMDDGSIEAWAERFAADIDPSFPEPIEAEELSPTSFLGNIEQTTSQWIECSALPDIGNLAHLTSIDGIAGPWILLNGQISEESMRLDRNFYLDCKAFLVNADTVEKLVFYWGDSEQNRNSRPELHQTSYLFSGELNHLSETNLPSDIEIELVIGTKIEQQINSILEMIKSEDGSLTLTTRNGELEYVEVPVTDVIKVCSPVAEYSWSAGNSVMPSLSARVLTTKLMNSLGLKLDPVTFDILDQHGKLAARNLAFKGLENSNYRHLFYIREDLLNEFMSKENLELVWCAQGERRVARVDQINSTGAETLTYKSFSFCRQINF